MPASLERGDAADGSSRDEPVVSEVSRDQTTATADGEARGRRDERPLLERGTLVGRYVILELLGRGGMGAVYAAYDPELDRRVAVKLVSVDGPVQGGSAGRDRLLREAQSLAQLSHPNVVAVHDVGVAGDDVFIALELVSGATLDEWLAAADRSWRDIVRVLRAAGEGLAAAHAAGIIHRDFKPGNVIIGDDGRVRVLDFGLARASSDTASVRGRAAAEAIAADAEGAVESAADVADPPLGANTVPLPAPETSAAGTPDAVMTIDPLDAADRTAAVPAPSMTRSGASTRGRSDQVLTRAGSLVGTPAYMSPEQLWGEELDPATDQFSFCVTAYEALFGRRPYQAGNLLALRRAVRKRPAEPPAAGVPGWVRRIVMRGLEPEPGDRFPDMRALLDELRRVPRARRRNAMIAAVALAVMAIALLLAGISRDRGVAPCGGGEADIAAVWNADERAALERAFAASEAAGARAAAERVTVIFDEYARAWPALRRDSCEATRVRGEQSEHLLDLRTACLRRSASDVAHLIAVLSDDPDRQVIDRAVQAATAITSLEACRDDAALLSAVAPPADPAVAAAVERLRESIGKARALELAGRYEAGLELAQRALAEAETLDYRPIEALARFRTGTLLDHAGKYAEAGVALERAGQLAGAVRDHELLADAWIWLMWVDGYRLGDRGRARAFARAADVAVTLAGDDPLRRAGFLDKLATVLLDDDDYDGALQRYQRALALYEEHGAGDTYVAAVTRNNIGRAHVRAGHFGAAEPYLRRALEGFESILGPVHPMVAGAHLNIGRATAEQWRYAEAAEHFARAAELDRETLGPAHPYYAFSLTNLGLVRLHGGDLAAAHTAIAEAVRILVAAVGPDHEHVGKARMALARVLKAQGELAAAEDEARSALSIVSTSSADSRLAGETHACLGEVLLRAGRAREAATALRAGIDRMAARLEADHWLLAAARTELAEALLALGQPTAARVEAEAALASLTGQGLLPVKLAWTRVMLAQALWQTGERERALEQARIARSSYTGLAEGVARRERAELATWLAGAEAAPR